MNAETHEKFEVFVECEECRKKPGSPPLCDDCLRRRAEIDARNSRVKHPNKPMSSIRKFLIEHPEEGGKKRKRPWEIKTTVLRNDASMIRDCWFEEDPLDEKKKIFVLRQISVHNEGSSVNTKAIKLSEEELHAVIQFIGQTPTL